MAGPAPAPGFNSMAEFVAAIEREANQQTGSERRYPSERKPQQRASVPQTHGAVSGPMRGEGDFDAEGFRLAGKPGSPERLQQIRERYPEMYPEVNRELEAGNLSKLLTAYLDNPGHHDQVAAQVARMVVDIDDPGIFDQVREVLDGTPVLEQVEHRVAYAVQSQIDRYEQETREERQAALEGREQKLQSELDRLHPEDAQFVLDAVPAEDMYELPEDEATLHMRTAAELNASHRKGLSEFAFMAPIVDELKRYGPTGSDEERERWERELEESTLRSFDRHMIDPEQAVDRAADSIVRERKGVSPGLAMLNEELAALSKTDEQIDAEVERSKRLYPENYIPTGEQGALDNRTPVRTSQTEWES